MCIYVDYYFKTSGHFRQAAFTFRDFSFVCVQGSLVSFRIGNSVVLIQPIRICLHSIEFALK